MKKRKYIGFRICVLASYFFGIIWGIVAIIGLICDPENWFSWILSIVFDLSICLPGSKTLAEQYKKAKASVDDTVN